MRFAPGPGKLLGRRSVVWPSNAQPPVVPKSSIDAAYAKHPCTRWDRHKRRTVPYLQHTTVRVRPSRCVPPRMPRTDTCARNSVNNCTHNYTDKLDILQKYTHTTQVMSRHKPSLVHASRRTFRCEYSPCTYPDIASATNHACLVHVVCHCVRQIDDVGNKVLGGVVVAPAKVHRDEHGEGPLLLCSW
jgi:hypothetical protein